MESSGILDLVLALIGGVLDIVIKKLGYRTVFIITAILIIAFMALCAIFSSGFSQIE